MPKFHMADKDIEETGFVEGDVVGPQTHHRVCAEPPYCLKQEVSNPIQLEANSALAEHY
jgi:hypothetical protein